MVCGMLERIASRVSNVRHTIVRYTSSIPEPNRKIKGAIGENSNVFTLQRTQRGLKTDENFMSLLFSEGVKTEFYPALVSIPKRAKTGMA